jgi:hypothetical protein
MPLAIDEHPVGDLSHIPPELIRLLRARIKRYGTTSGGRIFQAAWGRIIQNPAYGIVWANARTGTRRTDSHNSHRLWCTKMDEKYIRGTWRLLGPRPVDKSWQQRKRPVFCNALGYAVEQGT